MVDRSAIGRSSHKKGSGYESEVSKELTDWYNKTAKEPLEKAFYVVPRSGAYDWSASMNVDGDVTADPEINFNYLVECKRYESWTIENLIKGNSHFPEWIAQSVREGINVGRVPLLVYRRNRVKTFITAPFNAKLAKEVDTYIVKTLSYKSELDSSKEKIKTITFLLEDFVKIPYDKANNLYDGVDWTKQVIKSKKKTKKKVTKDANSVADDILERLRGL